MSLIMKTIFNTDLKLPFHFRKLNGKVRDIYIIEESIIALICSDRISAFDVVLPRQIPFKGQVLNQTAAFFLNSTKDIVPNYLLSCPDPNVSLGYFTEALPVEVVVRGYLCGHAWRIYKSGGREICGVIMPEGMKENDPFPEPIITPATKSAFGHDVDISEYEIIKSGIIDDQDWQYMRYYALNLYNKGNEIAKNQGLILADTKYEFGLFHGEVILIDEVHTPDSSRYFYLDGFEERQIKGEQQKQLSKEFVREWLMANGFQGLEGQIMPVMDDAFVLETSNRYINLYETVTGQKFEKQDTSDPETRIYENIMSALNSIKRV